MWAAHHRLGGPGAGGRGSRPFPSPSLMEEMVWWASQKGPRDGRQQGRERDLPFPTGHAAGVSSLAPRRKLTLAEATIH